jgi:hypothetical protein
MKIVTSLRSLVQTVVLLISIGLLWPTIAFYFNYNLDESRRFGTGFLIVYTIFLALFFEGMYEKLKVHKLAHAQTLAKAVNRVLRDAGIAALAGFVLERISELEEFHRIVISIPGGVTIVEYGFPFAARRITFGGEQVTIRIVNEFIDNFAKNVVVLGLIALASVEVPLISYEIYKWKKEKRNPKDKMLA